MPWPPPTQAQAGRRKRVAECNRAAVDIEPVAVQPQFAFDGDGLGALCFVDLKACDLVERQTTSLQQQANGGRRTGPHDLGRHAHRRCADAPMIFASGVRPSAFT